MRILVRSPIGTTGGFARDGIGLIKALSDRKHVVDVQPEAVLTPLPPEIAQLLTFPITDGYDLEIHHVPPNGAEVGMFNKQRSRKVVLWTMWEWDTFPKSVPSYANTSFIKNYDQVVGYTDQTLEVFEAEGFLGEDQPRVVVQGGFDPSPWFSLDDPKADPYREMTPSRKNQWGTCRFAMVGHLAARKNPYTVLTAFNELKEELGDEFDAELIFKTGFPMLPPNYDAPGVKVIQEIGWSDAQLRQFYWSIDCLINVSWGEGKDLPALEATMCGTPVILNATPGHLGWVHPYIQPLLPVTKMNMDPEYVGYFTSKDDIKTAMLDVYRQRVVAYDRAKQLSAYVGRQVTWDYRVEKFGQEIGLPL